MTRTNRLNVIVSIATLTFLLASGANPAPSVAPQPQGTLYAGFTLIDPVEQTVTEDAWLVVEEGRIAAYGAGPVPYGSFSERHDLSGLYALPGFIDVHGHLTAGPHAVEVRNGEPTVTMDSAEEITEFNASMALAFGVTTVRNPGADPEASAAYDLRVSAGDWRGPDAYHAGAIIQPPPFGGAAFAYPRTDEEWSAEAARQVDLGARYFKLYQGLTEAEIETGVRVAREHGLEPIAHLNQVSWTRAAELGVRGFLHALPTSPDLLEPGAREAYLDERTPDSRFMYQWFERVDFEGPQMQALFRTLAETEATVDITLQVNVLMTGPEALERIYPPEHEPYMHPQTRSAILAFAAMALHGWSEEDTRRAEAAMERVFEFARRLDAAGVTMGIGTDGPGGGPSFATELELMIDAGFEPWRVLELATAGGARVMGLEDQTGRWAVGYEADVVLLRANPLDDMANARSVGWVINNGKLYDVDLLIQDAVASSEDQS